jgi:hypothetical protein
LNRKQPTVVTPKTFLSTNISSESPYSTEPL